METEIVNGSIWTRNGDRVVVVDAGLANDGTVALTTKDADAANWSRAIVYQDLAAEGPRRTRSLADFRDKFTPEA